MPIIEPKETIATNNSDAMDLYFYRKSYKNNVLMIDDFAGNRPSPGTVDLWYDRNLYGKLDLNGNIVIPREKFLDSLWNSEGETLYAINFVALMFNDMVGYIRENIASNKIPIRNTIFKKIGADSGWDSVYDTYHDYMVSIFNVFADFLIEQNKSHTIANFEEFVHQFFIFARTNIIKMGRPLTLSSYVTSNFVSPKASGLIIDLFDAESDDDIKKVNIFINDVNYNFIKHAATIHGFVLDKNNPWRVVANLSSERMRKVMQLSRFNVTYKRGQKNIFDRYYRKTNDFDLIFLRNYMYMFYNSLVQSNPAFEKSFLCAKTNKFIKKMQTLAPLTDSKTESLTVKDYWMEKYYRFRLAELNHDLREEQIAKHIEKAKSIYKFKGEKKAIDFLYRKTKKFFISHYNEVDLCVKTAPMFYADFMKK